jgi:hypothetical protein
MRQADGLKYYAGLWPLYLGYTAYATFYFFILEPRWFH